VDGDIYLHTEAREPGGRWRCVDASTRDEADAVLWSSLYSDRDHDVQSILGLGYTGIKAGEGFSGAGFSVVAPPRGLPADVSPEVNSHAQDWLRDGDCFSWLSLRDIREFDWTQRARKIGVVGLLELARWKVHGAPGNWAGMIGGPDIQVFSAERAVPLIERVLESTTDPRTGRTYTWRSLLWGARSDVRRDAAREPEQEQEPAPLVRAALSRELQVAHPLFRVGWEVPYFKIAESFLGTVVPQLWRLGADSDVRLVYWFHRVSSTA
jgi:hypothetical protein